MWAGQLGDGRAISLGELVDPAGKRWELQLKVRHLGPSSPCHQQCLPAWRDERRLLAGGFAAVCVLQ